MDLKEIIWERVGWINQVPDRGNWRGFVNTLIKFELHKLQGIF
jgi:hypothetical protein